MKRFLLWATLLVGVVAVLGVVFGFRLWLKEYLGSETARQVLSRKVSSHLGTPGEFSLLKVESLDALYADHFIGGEGAVFQSLHADQLRAEVAFGFLARTVTIHHLEVARLRAVLRQGNPSAPVQSASAGQPASEGWVRSFALQQLLINRFDLSWEGGELGGTTLKVTPAPGGTGEWLFAGQRGTLKTTTGPQWRVEAFSGRQRGDTLFLNTARLRTGERGEATLEGEFATGRPAQARAVFAGVEIGPLLPEDWRAKLIGVLSGQMELAGSWGKGGVRLAEGEFELKEGELQALPLLERVAEVTRTEQFRRLRFHTAKARVRQKEAGGPLVVSDLLVESRQLLKIEGGFTLSGGRIEGEVQLGVLPGTLDAIPGARKAVFTREEGGYLWTPVKLSGLAAHPSEDLTLRLAKAAADEALDTALPAGVRENVKEVLDTVTPLLPKEVPILPGLLGR